MGFRKERGEPDFEDMTPFEQWFCGSGAYADGDLVKDKDGNYEMPMTQEFYECWKAAQRVESHQTILPASVRASFCLCQSLAI